MPNFSDNIRGAIFMMLSMAGFAINDAMMKLLADDVELFQAVFIRGVFATLLLALLAYVRGALKHPAARVDKVLCWRIFGEFAGMVCFLTAVFNIPIANATAIIQATPLAVTLAAALLMDERVGWRRLGAISIGFIGVMIIVRPGMEGFSIYSVSALAAVFFLVIRDLSTRRLNRAMPSLYIAFCSSLVITIISALMSLFFTWTHLSLYQYILLSGAAIFVFIGYLFGVMTMRIGEIGFIAPYRYTVLIWALMFGYILFDDIPDQLTLLGSTIVVGMGIYSIFRERTLAAKQKL